MSEMRDVMVILRSSTNETSPSNSEQSTFCCPYNLLRALGLGRAPEAVAIGAPGRVCLGDNFTSGDGQPANQREGLHERLVSHRGIRISWLTRDIICCTIFLSLLA